MAEEVDVNEAFRQAQVQAAAGRESLSAAHGEMSRLLGRVRNATGRGTINQARWDCERGLGRRSQYFSQSGQDAWLAERIFRDKRDGVFVEIGGYDGVTGSNCLFFELRRGWTGLLVEPSPTLFDQASAARRCDCHQLALAAAEGEAPFLEIREGYTQMGGLVDNYDERLRHVVEDDERHDGDVISVPTRTLNQLLDDAGYDAVDYISLDVEGAEMAVLEGFDFDRFRVTAWTVENNRGDTTVIPAFMQSKGYDRVERLGADDVYLLRDR